MSLGSEVLTIVSGGLDTSGHVETNPILVTAERILRRWFTVRGTCPWARNMGVGLSALVNADMTRDRIAGLEAEARAEALRVVGVVAATVKADLSSGILRLKGQITIASGETFTIIAGADRAVEVLS